MNRTKIRSMLGVGGLSVLAATAFLAFDGSTSFSLSALEGATVTNVTDAEAPRDFSER